MNEDPTVLPVVRRFPFAPLCDHLFLMRPLLLLPVWAAFLLGARAADGWGFGTPRALPSATEGWGLLATSLVVAAIYILNQLADVRVDERNGKLFLLATGAVSRRAAWFQMLLLGAGAVIVAERSLPSTAWVLLGGSLLVGVTYSLPPMRWKARPVFDVVANAVAYGVLSFLLGWAAVDPHVSLVGLRRSLPYGAAAGALFLLSTLEDLPGDRACGLRTSAVTFGERGVRRSTAVLAVSAPLLALLVGETPALVWGVICAPAYLLHLRDGDPAGGFRLNHLAGRLLVLLAAPGAFLLALPVAALYFAARSYYRRRFGIRYPRLALHAVSSQPAD